MSNPQVSQSMRQLAGAQKQFFSALPGLPWLALVLLMLALVLTGLALHKMKQVIAEAKTVVMVEKSVSYVLQKEPLTANEYQSILNWFQRLHPDVAFEPTREGVGLIVAVADGNRHADWLYALSALQSRDQDVLWETADFCIGRCPANNAAYAIVKGYRQKINKQ